MTEHDPSLQLLDTLSLVRSEMAGLATRDDALGVLARLAVKQVPGAMWAGFTHARQGTFVSIGATEDAVERVDRIQYRLRSGPCVDAVLESGLFHAPDLRRDHRWPQFGREAYETTGVISMLAVRIFLEHDRDTVAGLNMYSTTAEAFDARSETAGIVLASAGALAVAAATIRQRADNLEIALANSRQIGVAIGVLMSGLKVTRDQAFDLLRVASQGLQRKLADVALDVIDTGALPELPPRRRSDPGT